MYDLDDSDRLRHMLDAARKANRYISSKTREDLDSDEPLVLALTRLVEIIGEAAKNVTAATRNRHAAILWKAIIGTRDRLAHGYFDVDLDILWEIVLNDLPPLIRELEKIVPSEE